MKILRIIALTIVGLILGIVLLVAALPKADRDPRADYVSVQPLLVAQAIGVRRADIADWDRSLETVALAVGNTAQVWGWYRTTLQRPNDSNLYYQAIVRHEPGSDTYRAECFVLYDAIAQDGGEPCFEYR